MRAYKMPEWKEFLQRVYFDPKQPGAFSGPKKVQALLKENNFRPTLKQI